MATRPVVVGVDGSEESPRAVEWAAVPVRQDVVRGHPARVLASYTARSDLVVIGRHGGHDTGPAIGAVQHGVLSHAHGPIAIVPVKSGSAGS